MGIQCNMIIFQIFRETEGVYFLHQVSSAQCRGYFTAEHVGVATRDENPSFLICQSACEVFPSFYVLYFVQKDDRLEGEHLFVTFYNQMKFFLFNIRNAFVLKVNEENFLFTMSIF